MKILVTGGAGFIGSKLSDELIKRRHQVVIIDNLSTGFKKNINPKAKFFQTSLANFKKIDNILKKEKPQAVFHLAAQIDVRKSVANPLAVLFGVASASDALDGYLARKTGRVTVLGKFLDPLADKLLVMACLVFMVNTGQVDAWLAALLIGREMSITGLRAIASSEGLVIPASAGGKNKTAFQLAGIGALIIHFPYPILWTRAVVDFHVIGVYLLYISLLFSVFSAIEYVQLFVEAAEDDEGEKHTVRDL